jgi:hypothetical protein
MKTQNSRPRVPHNGKKNQSSLSKKLIASSWDDQPDLSDEPELPPLDVNEEDIPDADEMQLSTIEYLLVSTWRRTASHSYHNDEEEVSDWCLLIQLKHELLNQSVSAPLDLAIENIRAIELHVERKLAKSFYAFILESIAEYEMDLHALDLSGACINLFDVQNKVALYRLGLIKNILSSMYINLELATPLLDIEIKKSQLVEISDSFYYQFNLSETKKLKRVDVYRIFGRFFNKVVDAELYKNIAVQNALRTKNKALFLSQLLESYLKATASKK